MQRWMAWLLPLVLCGLVAAADDETVRDFERLYRKFGDPVERTDAVLALLGIEDPSVVEALMPVLRDEDERVRRAAVEVLSELSAADCLVALEAAFVDARREEQQLGLLEVYERNGVALGEEGLETLEDHLDDRDWKLRLRAVRGLPTTWPAEAEARLVVAVDDDELAVRCAALDALARLGTDAAIDAALGALDAEAWQQRVSAVAVLGAIRRQRSIAPLVARIAVEEGRLVADIAAALENLTGRDYGPRPELWVRFWERVADRYTMPTEEELERQRENARRDAQRYGAVEGVAYHGIDTPSVRILFVLDVSGSMDNLVLERERYENQDFRSWKRIDVVRRELQRAIEGLAENVEFNVLAFARELDPWRSKLVGANALQKRAAVEWLDELEVIGGTQDKELAEVGLVSTADLDAGRTNSYAALMYALGVIDADGDRLDEDEYAVPVDTVFFLSDGRPSVGEFIDPDDILREVREVNALRKVVIHTLALGQFRKDFMESLAVENGGVFVDLGK